MAHDVFISYAHKDKPTADAACATLESRGVRCWIAPRDVLPGEEYASALVSAIHASRMLVLVFSSGANQSPQVLREVERAVSKGLPILPLRIEDVAPSAAMEYYISSRHWLDALTTPLEQHLVQLADTVTLLLARAPGGSAPTAPAPAVRPVPPISIEEPLDTLPPPPPPPPPRAAEPAPVAPEPAAFAAEPARLVKPPADPDRAAIVVAGVFMLLALGVSPGWQRDYAEAFGWTGARVRAMSTMHLLMLALGFAVGGWWLRRSSPRRIATVAGLLYGVGLVLAGVDVAGHVWFVLTFECLAGFGAGLGYIVAVTTLLRWYPHRRGMIAGVATAAFGAGAVGTRALTTTLGWRSLVPLGIVALIAVIFTAQRLQGPSPGYAPPGWAPSATQRRNRATAPLTLRGALGSWQWYALGAMLFLNTSAGIIAVQNLLLTEVASKGTLVAVLAALSLAGSLTSAAISDRLGARQVFLVILGVQALLLLIIPTDSETGALLVMAVMLLNGGGFSLMPALAADCFGTDDLGSVYGLLMSAWCLALALAPSALMLGMLLAFAEYRQRYIAAAVMLLAATVIGWLLRPPGAAAPALPQA